MKRHRESRRAERARSGNAPAIPEWPLCFDYEARNVVKLLGEGTFVLHYATATIDDVASCARLTGLTTREKPRRPKVTHLAPKSRAIRARALTITIHVLVTRAWMYLLLPRKRNQRGLFDNFLEFQLDRRRRKMSDSIELVIKAANGSVDDFKMTAQRNWTVTQVKNHIYRHYPTPPVS